MAEGPPYALSVLDQVPVPAGVTPADAVHNTIDLAVLADRLGYRRYWLAEHHNSATLAASTPEILVARIAAATEHIRVGAGGVMLMHYSPLKVAENFRMLEAMFPGRIDLGIGRAPGADALTTVALAQGPPRPPAHFPAQVRDLSGFLSDSLPADHPFAAIRAHPSGAASPLMWLLGSTDASASLAAYFGLAFSMGQFIDPSAPGPRIMANYRAAFCPSPHLARPRGTVAVFALCADTETEAMRLMASNRLMHLRILRGEPAPVPTVDEAQSYGYTAEDRLVLDEAMSGAIIGAPERVKAQMDALVAAYAVDEIVVLTICHDPAARQRSYALLAEVCGLLPTAIAALA